MAVAFSPNGELLASAEAAEAARDFSEGVRESGVCSGAAVLVLGAGLMAAVVQRRR